jgi:hypothetical protein
MPFKWMMPPAHLGKVAAGIRIRSSEQRDPVPTPILQIYDFTWSRTESTFGAIGTWQTLVISIIVFLNHHSLLPINFRCGFLTCYVPLVTCGLYTNAAIKLQWNPLVIIDKDTVIVDQFDPFSWALGPAAMCCWFPPHVEKSERNGPFYLCMFSMPSLVRVLFLQTARSELRCLANKKEGMNYVMRVRKLQEADHSRKPQNKPYRSQSWSSKKTSQAMVRNRLDDQWLRRPVDTYIRHRQHPKKTQTRLMGARLSPNLSLSNSLQAWLFKLEASYSYQRENLCVFTKLTHGHEQTPPSDLFRLVFFSCSR